MAKDRLVVVAKVKDYVKEQGLMSSAELVEALNDRVYECLDRAIERAEENDRKTVQPRDV